MFYAKNLPAFERVMRIAVGIGLTFCGMLYLKGVLGGFWGVLFAIVRRECQRLARMALGRVSLEDAATERRLISLPMDQLRLNLSLSMQSLPESYREIVLLRDVEMLTIGSIAERLSLTREAVKARLHRARKSMREYLRGSEAADPYPFFP